jgi:hypothetical protein
MAAVKKFASNILTAEPTLGLEDQAREVEIHVRVRGSNTENIRVDIGGNKRTLLQKFGGLFQKLWELVIK